MSWLPRFWVPDSDRAPLYPEERGERRGARVHQPAGGVDNGGVADDGVPEALLDVADEQRRGGPLLRRRQQLAQGPVQEAP